MKRTLLTVVGVAVILAGLVGLLFGLQMMNQPPQVTESTTLPTTTAQPTTTVATVQVLATTEITEPSTEETTVPPTEPLPPPPTFTLSAHHAFVYDSKRDMMIFNKGDVTDHLNFASTTKLFTAYVGLQYLTPEQEITVGKEVTMIDPASTRAELYPGNRLTVEMLVYAMMLPSGNDAAYTMAVSAARQMKDDPNLCEEEALAVFVEEMNRQAKELGMEHSHFANPDGITHPDHYTSLQDLMTIGNLAMQNELILKCAGTSHKTVKLLSGQTRTWKTTNLLLRTDTDCYNKAAFGLKTGTTNAAGLCLVSVFHTEDDGYLLIGVLGCGDNVGRYKDTLQLYSYYSGVPVELPKYYPVPDPTDPTEETTEATGETTDVTVEDTTGGETTEVTTDGTTEVTTEATTEATTQATTEATQPSTEATTEATQAQEPPQEETTAAAA